MSGYQLFKHCLKVGIVGLTWLPVAAFVNTHVVAIGKIDGDSMKPALNPDSNGGRSDIVLLWKYYAHLPYQVKRGDIVFLRSPLDPNSVVTKRVVGIPGDEVITRGNYGKKTEKVRNYHLWVEGDNSSRSVDSNTYGPVSTALLEGVVTRVIYPLDRWGPVSPAGGRGRSALVVKSAS